MNAMKEKAQINTRGKQIILKLYATLWKLMVCLQNIRTMCVTACSCFKPCTVVWVIQDNTNSTILILSKISWLKIVTHVAIFIIWIIIPPKFSTVYKKVIKPLNKIYCPSQIYIPLITLYRMVTLYDFATFLKVWKFIFRFSLKKAPLKIKQTFVEKPKVSDPSQFSLFSIHFPSISQHPCLWTKKYTSPLVYK